MEAAIEAASLRLRPILMTTGAMVLGLSYVYVRRFLAPANLTPLALSTWQIGLALLVLQWTGKSLLDDLCLVVVVFPYVFSQLGQKKPMQ